MRRVTMILIGVASIVLLLASVLVAALIPSLASAAVKEFRQPEAYAVVVGISQYREEVVPKVPYAVKDAQAVAAMLEEQAGIPKTHIKLLTDAKATVGDFRNYFGDWLRMRVKPESTVYVYYAGHGTPNPKTGEAYLVPWEGHPDFPSGLYPLKELYDQLNKLPAKEIVVLLDSCFSGATGRSVLAKGARPMVVSIENPLLASGKVVVLAAATGNQISSDYDKAEHGLFTHFLLAGLGGEADKDQDKVVTLHELFPYVRDLVAHTAVEELNREQTPVLLPGEDLIGKRSTMPLASSGNLRTARPSAAAAGTPKPGPSAALSQAQQELKALEEQDRLVEEQVQHAALQQQIEEKKRQIEEKKKNIQVARARPYEAPRQTGREITGKDGAPMVLVAEGEFLYGDDKQRISLPAFYMDKFEVSTKLYASFLQATSREKPRYWNDVSLTSDGDRPVVGVTWHDADAYCRQYGKRLPTEQEWEKAARGTDGRKYPWGNEEPNKSLASYNWDGNRKWQGYATLASVEGYDAGKSPYGLYNMAGNVWEWTSSNYDDIDKDKYKVLRGGSWDLTAFFLRSAARYFVDLSNWNSYRGVRCAQDAS